MPPDSFAEMLDDLFHGCAIAAFVEIACQSCSWPGSEATRQLAYRLYEAEIASRNEMKTSPSPQAVAV
jgi:hypothetical protein